jgi:hypothetical protein
MQAQCHIPVSMFYTVEFAYQFIDIVVKGYIYASSTPQHHAFDSGISRYFVGTLPSGPAPIISRPQRASQPAEAALADIHLSWFRSCSVTTAMVALIMIHWCLQTFFRLDVVLQYSVTRERKRVGRFYNFEAPLGGPTFVISSYSNLSCISDHPIPEDYVEETYDVKNSA